MGNGALFYSNFSYTSACQHLCDMLLPFAFRELDGEGMSCRRGIGRGGGTNVNQSSRGNFAEIFIVGHFRLG